MGKISRRYAVVRSAQRPQWCLDQIREGAEVCVKCGNEGAVKVNGKAG